MCVHKADATRAEGAASARPRTASAKLGRDHSGSRVRHATEGAGGAEAAGAATATARSGTRWVAAAVGVAAAGVAAAAEARAVVEAVVAAVEASWRGSERLFGASPHFAGQRGS